MRKLGMIGAAALALCGLVGPARADFSDTFTEGINATDWTLTQTNSGDYTYSTGANGLTFAHAAGSGFENITMSLNLQAALGVSEITGNFSVQIGVSNISGLGSGIDQIELHTNYADGGTFFDNIGTDTNPNGGAFGQNYHVWTGSAPLKGYTPTSATSGTFVISRTGSTVSGYFDGTLIYSDTETSALNSIGFVLQNYSGSDPIQATYTDFSVAAPSIVPEPASITVTTIGMVLMGGLAAVRRSRRRH